QCAMADLLGCVHTRRKIIIRTDMGPTESARARADCGEAEGIPGTLGPPGRRARRLCLKRLRGTRGLRTRVSTRMRAMWRRCALEERRSMANVLIVDDDFDAAEILADVLRSEGHEVELARNGHEGLATLAAKRPDVVLLDVEMPILTGPEMAYQAFL